MLCIKCGIKMVSEEEVLACPKCGRIVYEPTVEMGWPKEKPFLTCRGCGEFLYFSGKNNCYYCLNHECALNDCYFLKQAIFTFYCHKCKKGIVDSRTSRRADNPADGYHCPNCDKVVKDKHLSEEQGTACLN